MSPVQSWDNPLLGAPYTADPGFGVESGLHPCLSQGNMSQVRLKRGLKLSSLSTNYLLN